MSGFDNRSNKKLTSKSNLDSVSFIQNEKKGEASSNSAESNKNQQSSSNEDSLLTHTFLDDSAGIIYMALIF